MKSLNDNSTKSRFHAEQAVVLLKKMFLSLSHQQFITHSKQQFSFSSKKYNTFLVSSENNDAKERFEFTDSFFKFKSDTLPVKK